MTTILSVGKIGDIAAEHMNTISTWETCNDEATENLKQYIATIVGKYYPKIGCISHSGMITVIILLAADGTEADQKIIVHKNGTYGFLKQSRDKIFNYDGFFVFD